MKAAYIEETGGPENLKFGDLPDPTPTVGEVLVRVGAVSVTPIDTYVRGGMVPAELPMPFVVGSDLAGTVATLLAEPLAEFSVSEKSVIFRSHLKTTPLG